MTKHSADRPKMREQEDPWERSWVRPSSSAAGLELKNRPASIIPGAVTYVGKAMTDLQRLYAYGVMLNSALYLTACFVAGLYAGNTIAWRFSIAAIGLTYLSHTGQFIGWHYANWLVGLSVLAGAAAGLALLF